MFVSVFVHKCLFDFIDVLSVRVTVSMCECVCRWGKKEGHKRIGRVSVCLCVCLCIRVAESECMCVYVCADVSPLHLLISMNSYPC